MFKFTAFSNNSELAVIESVPARFQDLSRIVVTVIPPGIVRQLASKSRTVQEMSNLQAICQIRSVFRLTEVPNPSAVDAG